MPQSEQMTEAARRRAWTMARARDEVVVAIARHVCSGLVGSIRLTLPSGRSATVGAGPIAATLTLRTYAALWRSIRRGTLGFADAYMSGDVETRDLGELFRFFIDNRHDLERRSRGLTRGRGADRAYHRARANTHMGSRRNISAHYDLGNAFYRQWLDPRMIYSSALYDADAQTLEHAQQSKIAAIMDALDLAPDARVLEIGCGWGALAIEIARRGGDVTGITISDEQYRHADATIAAEGLEGRARIALQDYRDTEGMFDRIVSVEMVEAVGEEHWPVYFKTLHDRLVPGGAAVLQAITIRESSFEGYRSRPDFIQRYIFPGGMLPTKTILAEQALDAGLFFEPIMNFGQSYARTCAEWLARFESHWPHIAELGFDERFRRMWRYYLKYCEAGFDKGVIDVGLYRFVKAR